MKYTKNLPLIPSDEFLSRAALIEGFTSSNGRRYHVDSVDQNIMNLIRLDAEWEGIWPLDLEKVYKAYLELEDFRTASFRRYVPRMHSPARGLLLRLGLLS